MTFRMASTEYASMLSTARLADSSVSESKVAKKLSNNGSAGMLIVLINITILLFFY